MTDSEPHEALTDPGEKQRFDRERGRLTDGGPPDLSTPAVYPDGDAIEIRWADVEVAFDRLHYDRGYINGDLTIRWFGQALIARQRHNLQSGSQKDGVVRQLNRHTKDPPWPMFVEEAGRIAMRRFRTAPRLVPVRFDRSDWEPVFLIDDLWPDTARPSLLFGDSGSHKSALAMALALSVASGTPVVGDYTPARAGPVAYLDYEDEIELFERRMSRLVACLDIDTADVRHLRPPVPLHLLADSLAEEFDREGIVACVIDSQAPAQGSSLIDDEATNNFFNAVAKLNRPCQIITHVEKAGIKRDGAKHSFGSVFVRARVVSSFYVRLARQAGKETTVTLTDAKWNHGPPRPERSLILDWSDGLRIERRSEVYVPPSGETTDHNLAEDISILLHTEGPMRNKEIAESLDCSPGSTHNALARHPDKFRQRPDKLWEIAYREEDDELPDPM